MKNYFNFLLNSKFIFLYQTTKPIHVNTSTCNPTKRLRNHITTCIAKRMKKSNNPAQGSTEKMLRDYRTHYLTKNKLQQIKHKKNPKKKQFNLLFH